MKKQAAGERTPPDWWRELRKEEERKRWQADRQERAPHGGFDAAFDAYLHTEAKEAFGKVMDRIFQDLTTGGQSERDAKENAAHFARTHFVRRSAPSTPNGTLTARRASEILGNSGGADYVVRRLHTPPRRTRRDTLTYE